jgi:hypothetical protein
VIRWPGSTEDPLKLIALTTTALALGAASAMAVPSEEPNRGQTFYDYPPPVWVEAGAVHRWLDAPGIERPAADNCPEPIVPDSCGGNGIPRGVPPPEP